MADWNLESTWQQAYRARNGTPGTPTFGQIVSYLDGRGWADSLGANLRFYVTRVNNIGALKPEPATDALIVGCGFGWLMEVIFNEFPTNNLWGTDTSPLIHAGLATCGVSQAVQDRILNIDILSPTVKQEFIAAGAGTNKGEFKLIISEIVLNDMTLAEINTFLDACDNLRSTGQTNVGHIIIPIDHHPPGTIYEDSIMIQKLTLAEWAAIRPSHYWISSETGEVLGGQ